MFNDLDEKVLCGSSCIEKKYYFNEKYDLIPRKVKDELKILSVMFTEEFSGIFLLKFNEKGEVELMTKGEENDYLYDYIGANMKIKKLYREKKELLDSLNSFYKIFFLDK